MTLSDRLRQELRGASGVCPECGQPTNEGGVRPIAEAIGLSHATLWRFLKGRDITSRHLDLIDAWLRGREAQKEPQP